MRNTEHLRLIIKAFFLQRLNGDGIRPAKDMSLSSLYRLLEAAKAAIIEKEMQG